jgi:hypothetical protein
MIAAVIGGAGPLALHGMGEAAELPVPMMYAVIGASWALTLSFVVVAWAWREPRFGDEAARDEPPRRPWLAVVGLALTATVLGVLYLGPDTDENLALPAIYTGVWVGLVPLALLAGHVWRDLSPWRTVQAVVGRLSGRADGWRTYPDGLGYWPAAFGLFAFVWLELAWPHSESATAMRVWVGVYVGVTVLGGLLFGPRWYDRADPFDVYGAVVAKISPLVRDGRWSPHNPLRSLPTIPVHRGLVAVVAAILGSTAFDAFSALPMWKRGEPGVLATSFALLGFCVLAALLFAAATMATGGVSGGERTTLPASYAHALIPIAVGYVLAHYLTVLISTIATFLDVHDASAFIAAHTTSLAVLKVTLVVLGHVVAVLAAHDRALVLLPKAHRLTGQLVMLVLMVGYTFVGLFLLLTT